MDSPNSQSPSTHAGAQGRPPRSEGATHSSVIPGGRARGCSDGAKTNPPLEKQTDKPGELGASSISRDQTRARQLTGVKTWSPSLLCWPQESQETPYSFGGCVEGGEHTRLVAGPENRGGEYAQPPKCLWGGQPHPISLLTCANTEAGVIRPNPATWPLSSAASGVLHKGLLLEDQACTCGWVGEGKRNDQPCPPPLHGRVKLGYRKLTRSRPGLQEAPLPIGISHRIPGPRRLERGPIRAVSAGTLPQAAGLTQGGPQTPAPLPAPSGLPLARPPAGSAQLRGAPGTREASSQAWDPVSSCVTVRETGGGWPSQRRRPCQAAVEAAAAGGLENTIAAGIYVSFFLCGLERSSDALDGAGRAAGRAGRAAVWAAEDRPSCWLQTWRPRD